MRKYSPAGPGFEAVRSVSSTSTRLTGHWLIPLRACALKVIAKPLQTWHL